MNITERLAKLSGITTITEAFGEKKYADYDKSGLNAVKKELQGIMALAARSSFKYKNAQEELKVVEACLKNLEQPEKVDESEGNGTETIITNEDVALVEKKEEDGKDDDKDSKKDDDKSDKKDDSDDDKKDDDKEDKKEKKDSDDKKDDEKPDFFKKKDDKDDEKDDKKFDKKDSDDKEKKDDDSDDKKDDDKKSDKDDKEDDDDDGEKVVKVEVKVEEESAADIAKRLMEKDLTPTEVEVDYQNGPTENSGIKFEQGTKIRLPNAVRSEVNKRIKELENAILRYDDKGYDDKSIKQQAVDCLNQILQDLSTNDLEGVKKAQIYFETLMSPLTDFFPPQLINWLANAVNPYVGVKESLRPSLEDREAVKTKFTDSEWADGQRGSNILDQLRSGTVKPGSSDEKHLAISLAKYGDVASLVAAIKEGLSPTFGDIWVRQLSNYDKNDLVQQLFAEGHLKPYEAKLRQQFPEWFQ